MTKEKSHLNKFIRVTLRNTRMSCENNVCHWRAENYINKQ